MDLYRLMMMMMILRLDTPCTARITSYTHAFFSVGIGRASIDLFTIGHTIVGNRNTDVTSGHRHYCHNMTIVNIDKILYGTKI